ncbi:MAG: T9SS type A sorting domain-containing protein, partial [Bacteroidota bacterium]
AMVKRSYHFQALNQGENLYPALLELDSDLGEEIGYTGLYFDQDSAFYQSTLFHKFSYVDRPQPYDSSFNFTNDTLYYNHGFFDFLPGATEGIGALNAVGIEGQLGSSLIFQEADQDSSAYLVGVFSFASNYRHSLLRSETFYTLAALMGSSVTNLSGLLPTTEWEFFVFPNPIQEQGTIRLDTLDQPVDLYLWSLNGQCVRTWPRVEVNQVILEREGLASGIYLLEVRMGARQLGLRRIQFE